MRKKFNPLFRLLWPEYSEPWKVWLTFASALTGLLGAIATVTMMIIDPTPRASQWARVGLILWVVVPPAYFWFEYFILWKPSKPIPLEEIKYDQEVCRNIWLTFVALLAALYFK